MIAFAVARAKRILLISFPLPVTRETLERLVAERAAVVRREGAMDMIVDFSASPPVAIPSRLTHEHVAKPSPVPGFRRVYVAPRDDPRVQVVRSLDTAFAELGETPGEFEPLPASWAARGRPITSRLWSPTDSRRSQPRRPGRSGP